MNSLKKLKTKCNWCDNDIAELQEFIDIAELQEFIDIAGDPQDYDAYLCKRCAEQWGFEWEYQGE